MYLAPEVPAGQPSTIASDIYSLGILLLQMVIGVLQRLPTSGWESEIGDPLLVEDIALAAAGGRGVQYSAAGGCRAVGRSHCLSTLSSPVSPQA